ncbi:MAG: 3'-5' exoribonuclease [Prevotellaceae bacterium]|nr:3'-5' exoribonuclease [Prevotellaceae bacterium]
MEDGLTLKNANFIAIDFETATASTRQACQIGIVVVKAGDIVERICRLIQPPGNRYFHKCIEVHGITPQKTANEPTFDVVWKDIKEYFVGNFVVAHNAAFDLDVLHRALDFYNIPAPVMMGEACTYQLTGMSLEEACKTYDIHLCEHHDGLCDAEACARLYLKYLNGEVSYVEHTRERKPICESSEESKEKQDISHSFIFRKQIKGDLLKQDLSSANPDNPFYDKKVVITGVFSVERLELAEHLQKLGAKLSSSISRHTDIVIIGNEPGPSKMKLLKELKEKGFDIAEIFEAELMDILSKY